MKGGEEVDSGRKGKKLGIFRVYRSDKLIKRMATVVVAIASNEKEALALAKAKFGKFDPTPDAIVKDGIKIWCERFGTAKRGEEKGVIGPSLEFMEEER
ncbi:MAG: hypothetical protein ABH833_03820 [Parcubacteria group bacterium]